MTVDVLSNGLAGAKAIGREDSRQMSFQRLTQALEGLKATASRPGDQDRYSGSGFAPLRHNGWISLRRCFMRQALAVFKPERCNQCLSSI